MGEGRIKPARMCGGSGVIRLVSQVPTTCQGGWNWMGVVLDMALYQQLGASCHLCLFISQQFPVPATGLAKITP